MCYVGGVNFWLFFFFVEQADSKTLERKRRLKDDEDIKKPEEPPTKKRRSTDKQTAKTKSEPVGEEADPKIKAGNPFGALIGGKDKEWKSGTKGGGK